MPVALGTVASTISTIVEDVGAISEGFFGLVGDAVSTITSPGNEIIMFFILVPFLGLGIGLLKRLMRV